jgi:hypothetical protein
MLRLLSVFGTYKRSKHDPRTRKASLHGLLKIHRRLMKLAVDAVLPGGEDAALESRLERPDGLSFNCGPRGECERGPPKTGGGTRILEL